MRTFCTNLVLFLILGGLIGCRSTSPSLVGKWQRQRSDGSLVRMEYRADGSWTASGTKADDTPTNGTWKIQGQTLELTGTHSSTVQWHLSEDGKQLTTRVPNKPEQVWNRE